jgi:hypothetical protein
MDPAANMAAASPGIEPQFIGMTVAVATHCVNTTSIAMKKRNHRRSNMLPEGQMTCRNLKR